MFRSGDLPWGRLALRVFSVVAIGLLMVIAVEVDTGSAIGSAAPPVPLGDSESTASPMGTGSMERISAVAFESGENLPQAVITDGVHGYFGTRTSPGRVIKVRLSDMVRVGSVTLAAGENILYSAVTDGQYGYFGTDTTPGRVVKVRLSDLARIDAVTLNEGESYLTTAATDGQFGYFGTYTSPGRVVKVRLSDLARIDAVSFAAPGQFFTSAIADGGYGYFGTVDIPGAVVKVRLSDLAPINSLTLDFGTGGLLSAISDGVFGYFTSSQIPGVIVKVRLSDMQVVNSVRLGLGENFPSSAVTDGVFGYFGTETSPGMVVKVHLSDMTRIGSLTLNSGENEPDSAVTDGVHGYFATDTTPGRVVKVLLSDVVPQVPGRPGIPAVEAQLGSVRVTVVPPTSGGAPQSYLATATPAGAGPIGATCEVVVPATSCSLPGLAATTSYRVTVVAVNAAGSSPTSDPSIIVTPGAGSPTPQFDDVEAGRFFTEATSMLKLRGITTGISGTNNFRPSGQVTRAEMATFLYRMAGEPSVAPCTFIDQAQIPGFARTGACWLKAENITTNDPFNPNGLVNRAQMAAFMFRFAYEPPTAPCTFIDQAQIPVFARTGACWLKANGITTNDPYNPAVDVTRAQMAAFLYRTGGTLGYWISDNMTER